MKVNAALSNANAALLLSGPPAVAPTPGPPSFRDLFDKLSTRLESQDILGVSVHSQIQTTAKQIEAGKEMSTRELLLYQIRLGQLGLRVELLSKAAEAGLSTVRRLQQS